MDDNISSVSTKTSQKRARGAQIVPNNTPGSRLRCDCVACRSLYGQAALGDLVCLFMDDASNYTSFRLTHATPEHLHLTSLATFIGPIPNGWFATHKKHWLRPRTNYHRRTVSFSADEQFHEAIDDLTSCSRWRAEAAAAASVGTASESQALEMLDAHASSPPGIDEDDDRRYDGNATTSREEQSTTIAKDTEFNPQTQSTTSKPVSCATETQPDSEESVRPVLNLTDNEESVRPVLNLTSPTSGYATREASTVSTASFATAPETFQDDEDPFDAFYGHEDAENDHEAILSSDGESVDASDTSTIRLATRRMSQDQLAAQDLTSPETTHGENDNMLPNNPYQIPPSENTVSSSDANSRRSLMHGTRRDDLALLQRPNVQNAHNTPLVRFTNETPAQIEEHRANVKSGISPEGAEINRKASMKAQRRNQGYFNQKLLRNPFRTPKQPGELRRAERMLLRIEFARHGEVPDDYSESIAARIQRRTKMHWREFVLTARDNEQRQVVLQFHRNRTIPAFVKDFSSGKPSEEIVLRSGHTKVNFYSSLDKTIVIWEKGKKGTIIYILRPRAALSSIEWYAFIQSSLNLRPSNSAYISVPTLNVRLHIELQDQQAQEEGSNIDDRRLNDHTDSSSRSSSEVAPDALPRDKRTTLNDEGQIVTAGVAITGEYLVDTCWRMLSEDVRWRAVLEQWQANERMGLCWRRYDRLEWLHGHNARKLVGQWAMQTSHELEFRPKEHYATEVRLPSGKVLKEPPPVEGFLIRLTSSTGRQARFGKVFYKRLYMSSHDSLLFYSSPAKAQPPPPPAFRADGSVAVEEAISQSPLIFDVDPYPLIDGHIQWLQPETSSEEATARDRVAMTEGARRINQLQQSDGYIELCNVVKIRPFKRTRTDVQNDTVEHGGAVPFHQSGNEDEEILATDQGLVDAVDDVRIFELVLNTGLVIRLQAFDEVTRQAWMETLSELVKYWKWRRLADTSDMRKMRGTNIDILQIDEEVESLVGQYANKWEVSQCVSEPQIYNFCPISSCRTIALRGVLFRKPRVHATFRKYECVVSHGKLLLFNHSHTDAGGNVEHHIHHSLRQVVDLAECYIYSGEITVPELIPPRETSDREGPGRHTLPRLYQDGWTSQDEQESLCFVIWTARRRRAFSGVDRDDSNRHNSVSRLGVAGKSMVYMARSRQERDLWVQILGNEIERSGSTGTN